MKTAIVIGASGQDGYYLVNFLEEKNYRVIRVDRDLIDPTFGYSHDHQFDICEPAHVDVLIKDTEPDEIYFLAAFHQSAQDQYSETLEILERSIETHEISLFNLLSAIKNYSPRTKLFYAASSLIFGDPINEIQNENTPINPTTLYGITKASGLFLCRKFRKEHGVFSACGILYNHESSRRSNNFLSKKIVNGVVEALHNSSSIIEVGNFNSIADWGYAPDYVKAMIKIVTLPKPDDFIIATGIKHTVLDFVRLAFKSAGLDWQKHVVQRTGIINRITRPLIGDCSKLRNITDWKPSVTFEEMVDILVKEGIYNASK